MPHENAETGRSDEAHDAPRLDAPRRVTLEMRRAILRGDLLAGEQVRQNEWAKRLGVSGVPVREALKTLAAQRLVRHDPRRGYFVAKLDLRQVVQLYQLRLHVEGRILEEMAWPSPESIRELERLSATIAGHLRAGDVERASECHHEFKLLLWRHSSLDVYIEEAERLWLLTIPYRLSLFSTPVTDLGAFTKRGSKLSAALRSGDRRSLRQLQADELRATIQHLSKLQRARSAGARAAATGALAR